MAACKTCNGTGREVNWAKDRLWCSVGGDLYIGQVCFPSESLRIGRFSEFVPSYIVELERIFAAGQTALHSDD